ncbi:MAG: glycosyltransferase family 4 protein [Planctomycetes bacterium]|nr:glycosyltransferase family 4 protein [Planctomycetota bacterium]
MKTVVYVSATDELGGADASLFELVQSLDRSAWSAHVVVPHDGPFAARYRSLGIPVHVVPLRKLKNTRDVRWHVGWLWRAPLRVLRLLRLFRRLAPAVVHVNTSVEALAGLAAWWHCRRTGARFVWHVRELELHPRCVEKVLFGLVRNLADVVIAISTPVAARLGARERVYVIPNGLDLARFRGASAACGAAAAAAPMLGWVGRIAPGKGLDHVLAAFAQVRRELPRARLLVMGAPVAGHAHHAASLRHVSLAFGDAVEWLPPGPDTERAYARMDLFLHLPDLAEGLGRTVLEAQAAGVPVVAWPRGGLVDALQDGRTGLFAPAGDVGAAADLAVRLLRDPERRAAMAAAAAEFARTTFAREACARAVERTYAERLR